MRSSIAAQSCASVPPLPAWMSIKQAFGSIGLWNIRRNSRSSTVAGDARGVAFQRGERRVVLLAPRQLEQLGRVLERPVDPAQAVDDHLQLFFFLAELLRALGRFPDVRVFELPRHFLEARCLHIEVKDTSADRRRDAADRRAGWRFDSGVRLPLALFSSDPVSIVAIIPAAAPAPARERGPGRFPCPQESPMIGRGLCRLAGRCGSSEGR